MSKYHISIALRTAIVTHVAEILRDAGPKVVFLQIQTFEAAHNRFCAGKTYLGNRQALQGSPRKIGYVSGSVYNIVRQYRDQLEFSAFSLRIIYSRRSPRTYFLITVCHLCWTRENQLRSYWQGLLWVLVINQIERADDLPGRNRST